MEIAAITAFLAPLLGHLIKGTTDAANEAMERFGAAAWQRAVGLWRVLRDRLGEREAAREAVTDVAADPQNAAAQAALTWQLEKLLNANADLHAEVERLWAAGGGNVSTTTASGERSVAIGGNVTDSHVHTGDSTTQQPRPRPGGPGF